MNQKLIDEIVEKYSTIPVKADGETFILDLPITAESLKAALTEYAKRSAEAAPKEEPVAFFAGRRLTPSGTYEFYGYLNGDIQIENGTKLYAHPPADGMVLVPKEPTEEMLAAGFSEFDCDTRGSPDADKFNKSVCGYIYKAMISAGGK